MTVFRDVKIKITCKLCKQTKKGVLRISNKMKKKYSKFKKVNNTYFFYSVGEHRTRDLSVE